MGGKLNLFDEPRALLGLRTYSVFLRDKKILCYCGPKFTEFDFCCLSYSICFKTDWGTL